MIVTCQTCSTAYDDAYRWTICPHETFAANDGHNNFAHHPESFISKEAPVELRTHVTENYEPRINQLKRMIDVKAPPVIVAEQCMLVISAINRNSRWRAVWFVFKRVVLDHAKGETTWFLYKLRYRLSGYDPEGHFTGEDEC